MQDLRTVIKRENPPGRAGFNQQTADTSDDTGSIPLRYSARKWRGEMAVIDDHT